MIGILDKERTQHSTFPFLDWDTEKQQQSTLPYLNKVNDDKSNQTNIIDISKFLNPNKKNDQRTGDWVMGVSKTESSAYNEVGILEKIIPRFEVGNMFSEDILRQQQNKDAEILKKEVKKVETKLTMLKYYSFVCVVCALLTGFFIASGISGLLGPLSSFVGTVMSLCGIIGLYIDWKDKVKTS